MITLGSEVRDSLTGFAGIATSRVCHLHGCVHIGITPSALKDGKPVESQLFDEQRIEVLRGAQDPRPPAPYPLGGKVVDAVTGFEGVATSHTVYHLGPALVAVSSPTLFEGKPVEPQWFDEGRVKIIERRPPAVSPQSSATSGGPPLSGGRINR